MIGAQEIQGLKQVVTDSSNIYPLVYTMNLAILTFFSYKIYRIVNKGLKEAKKISPAQQEAEQNRVEARRLISEMNTKSENKYYSSAIEREIRIPDVEYKKLKELEVRVRWLGEENVK